LSAFEKEICRKGDLARMTMQGASASNGSRRVIRRVLLTLALPLCFRTFQFFPGMMYVQEAWFVLSLLMVLLFYPYLKIRGGLRVSRFEIYLAILMFGGTSLATFRANQVFGQPLAYGLLSQRAIVLIGVWLLFADLLRSGMLTARDVEASLICLAWGTFVLFSTMRLLLVPADFTAYSEGFVTRAMVGTEPSFKLQEFFILFGVFYYATKGLRSRRGKYYFAAAILFPAALGSSGRGLAISVVATIVFVIYRSRGVWGATFVIGKSAVVAAAFLGAAFAIFPNPLHTRIAGFSNAFAVVFTGAPTQDPSANSRIFETLAALPYIQQHLFLGNGVISNQWQGGSGAAMGSYFFASDIGFLGIIFAYGILGFLLYGWQYRLAWRAANQLRDCVQYPLLDATKAFVLFSAFFSIVTGICVWSAEVTLFFVALISGLASRELEEDSSHVEIGDQWRRHKPA